jgi:uncharacterized Tic20 family protein
VPPDAPRLSALPGQHIGRRPVAADSWPEPAAQERQDVAAGGWPAAQGPHDAAARPADPEDWQQEQPGTGYLTSSDAELAGDERWAMLSYLGVPFLGFLLPLAIYVLKRRQSNFVHYQSAQALNLALTGSLYTFCVLIVGMTLALDTITAGVLFAAPLAAALWIVTLGYVVQAAAAANRGEYCQIPAWICATIAR